MQIDELRIGDYAGAYSLWQTTPGIGLSSADSREAIGRYLERNPGMSSVAKEDGRVIATALAGHDGRRGYLHHVAVDPQYRRRGVGRAVVERSLERLRLEGIERCHLFIFGSNESGQEFWRVVGWKERADLRIYSRDTTHSGAGAPEKGPR